MSLLRTAGRAAVASSVHGRVQRKQAQKFAARDQAFAAQQQARAAQFTPILQPVQSVPEIPVPAVEAPPASSAEAAPAAVPSIDPERRITLLKELAELRSMEVLTEAEFQSEKARILA